MDTQKTIEKPAFTQHLDLIAERLGGKVLYATDDFFAEKENLIKQKEAIFIADKYTDRGKWMDGWESRRKRTEGHDWCIVEMATAGKIHGFDIDTSFFMGNQPQFGSIEAINLTNTEGVDWATEQLNWTEIVPKTVLNPGSHHYVASTSDAIFTHLKLHIFPDGGVARLRAYGEVFKNWALHDVNETIDLLAAVNGGKALLCNDMFFSHMDNLIMPNRGANMGDGWETKRNRTPNNRDWVILKLGHAGIVESIVVDTCHFKGNYPDSCLIEACFSDSDDKVVADKIAWQPLLQRQKLSADHIHIYDNDIENIGVITHIRLSIFPDGGVSRLRLFGKTV
ncbi:MAG: allantoicase [Saprospiraceae bacterium]|nr:allantoicase [Saprospiraceae bacterium]